MKYLFLGLAIVIIIGTIILSIDFKKTMNKKGVKKEEILQKLKIFRIFTIISTILAILIIAYNIIKGIK